VTQLDPALARSIRETRVAAREKKKREREERRQEEKKKTKRTTKTTTIEMFSTEKKIAHQTSRKKAEKMFITMEN